MNNLKIMITGDNGECIPPPYGGIMKRCLLHAGLWREYGSSVQFHVHHWHEGQNDLNARAQYFYDFPKPPSRADKIRFVISKFLQDPMLFTSFLFKQLQLGPERNASSLYYAGRAVRLDQEVRRERPDVLVPATGGYQTLAAAMVGAKRRIPIVFENYAELQYKAGPDGKNVIERYHALWRYILERVQVVIPASEHCAKGPRSLAPANTRIETVYSGINFDIFAAGGLKDKSEMRRSFGLPLERFIVMAVGALKMRKGHDQLFEALLQMDPADRTNVFVVLCGMGDVSDMQEKAKSLGFGTDSMKVFQGLTEERLAELYATADIFCFPSVTPRECMGMAMKEAMACGLPVAAYDTGGIKEAVIEGKGGYLAPVGDRAALAERIARLMKAAPEERRAMGAFNAARTREIFDIKVTARKLYDIIAETVSSYAKN